MEYVWIWSLPVQNLGTSTQALPSGRVCLPKRLSSFLTSQPPLALFGSLVLLTSLLNLKSLPLFHFKHLLDLDSVHNYVVGNKLSLFLFPLALTLSIHALGRYTKVPKACMGLDTWDHVSTWIPSLWFSLSPYPSKLLPLNLRAKYIRTSWPPWVLLCCIFMCIKIPKAPNKGIMPTLFHFNKTYFLSLERD